MEADDAISAILRTLDEPRSMALRRSAELDEELARQRAALRARGRQCSRLYEARMACNSLSFGSHNVSVAFRFPIQAMCRTYAI